MRFRQIAGPVAQLFRARSRRVSVGVRRGHVEYRSMNEEELVRFAGFIQRLVQGDALMTWAEVNVHTRRVVFAYADDSYGAPDLVELVEEAESLTRLGESPFASDGQTYPADVEHGIRRLVELVADTGSVAIGLGLAVSPLPRIPMSGNVAAALSIVRSSPRLRRGLEERFGVERARFLLNLSNSAAQGLAQRPFSALVDGLHKAAMLREIRSERAAWQMREEELCAFPSAPSSTPGLVGLGHAEPRPVELPRGPIEEYADRSWFVSLSGFGLSFLTTRSIQRASAALFGGLPRPARLGRDIFAAELGRALAARGSVVLDQSVLRRLDRIDCLVLQGDLAAQQTFLVTTVITEDEEESQAARERVNQLFDDRHPLDIREDGLWKLLPWGMSDATADMGLRAQASSRAKAGALVLSLERAGRAVAVVEVEIVARTGVEELVRAAQAAQMRVVIAADDEATVRKGVAADDVISPEEGLRAGIRRLQREGRGVCLVATGGSLGLPLADCGIGLVRDAEPMPWGAHILCRRDLADVRFIIEACIAARRVSKQCVNVALGAATMGALVSAGGILPLTTSRVMFVVNSASLLSMANGARHAVELRRKELPAPRDETPWHALDPEGALRRFGSSSTGLTRREVVRRAERAVRTDSQWVALAEVISDELFNPLAPLLAAGAGLSAVVGSFTDAGMVAGVVGLNAVVGGVQRFVTERRIEELARTSRRRALVRRDAEDYEVDSSDLVGGDIVVLNAGDIVPADCRILEAASLEVDASSLTGESLPVSKQSAPSFDVEVAERSSMLYEGTAIAAGRAVAMVVAVGDATEAKRGATVAKSVRVQGGVEKRLRSLMDLTLPMALVAGVGVVGGGLLRGRKLSDLVGSGVSLAVASVPEGLPLLATAAQLSAAQRLSERRALVRNARSIEALGRVDVICMDKTGTVTQGRMELHSVSDGHSMEGVREVTRPRLLTLSAALRACPDERLQLGPDDPTDEAVRRAASALGVGQNYLYDGWSRHSEVSFESGRSYHATRAQTETGTVLSVKGAPEAVIPLCNTWRRADDAAPSALDDELRYKLAAEATRLAARGLRVLAVAERADKGASSSALEPLAPEHLSQLSFVGFITFSDPVRPTALAALAGLRRAGVRTVMITGDHPSTARAIAEELQLLGGKHVMSGAELAELSDAELDVRLADIAVFARATPSQKVRVVRALQRVGRTVAMAGDGANDAPAIRLADVGIAVGEHSTSAARGAADVILMDGRIETLVDAIAEGRAMWSSVRDAVAILLGGNLGEIGFTLVAGLVDGRPPINARQLLLVNLLTDVAPAMAIALRPPSAVTLAQVANEHPDNALGQPLNRELLVRAGATTLGAGAAWTVGRFTGSRARAGTIGLAALVGTQLGQTLRAGGPDTRVVATGVVSAAVLAAIIQTPGVSHFFGCRPLGPIGWATAIGASAGATAISPWLSRWLEEQDIVDIASLPEMLRLGTGEGADVSEATVLESADVEI